MVLFVICIYLFSHFCYLGNFLTKFEFRHLAVIYHVVKDFSNELILLKRYDQLIHGEKIGTFLILLRILLEFNL